MYVNSLFHFANFQIFLYNLIYKSNACISVDDTVFKIRGSNGLYFISKQPVYKKFLRIIWIDLIYDTFSQTHINHFFSMSY